MEQVKFELAQQRDAAAADASLTGKQLEGSRAQVGPQGTPLSALACGHGSLGELLGPRAAHQASRASRPSPASSVTLALAPQTWHAPPLPTPPPLQLSELQSKLQHVAQLREVDAAAAAQRLRALELAAAELRSSVAALGKDLQVGSGPRDVALYFRLHFRLALQLAGRLCTHGGSSRSRCGAVGSRRRRPTDPAPGACLCFPRPAWWTTRWRPRWSLWR
jgi:hypothetical protein